jgi:hypothetical protein
MPLSLNGYWQAALDHVWELTCGMPLTPCASNMCAAVDLHTLAALQHANHDDHHQYIIHLLRAATMVSIRLYQKVCKDHVWQACLMQTRAARLLDVTARLRGCTHPFMRIPGLSVVPQACP